ncbi:LamG-like jellyroll fold domain-containing protein [Kribbella sp. NPDC050124]|uniref:LamG domain-containing protein n=1 Tax=Kribbella sp. NPDC050124 TaxID=3364114 RepID=UPI00378D1A9E
MVGWAQRSRLRLAVAIAAAALGVGALTGPAAAADDPPTPPAVTATYQGAELANCLNQPVCPKVVVFDDPVTFTLTATSPDVVRFRYYFLGQNYSEVDGSTATLELRPPDDGLMRLAVQSINSIGQFSTTTYFMFNVAPAPGPVGSWTFDDGSGTTAADGPGLTHPLTLHGGAAFDGKGRLQGSLALDGVDGYAEASESVIDTSQSFTIAGWVRPTSATKLGVVAAVNGTNSPSVALGYDPSTKRWIFARTSADVQAPTLYRASSKEAPVNGTWSHLLASYDATAHELRLYVNGRLQQTTVVPATAVWKADGPLTVGRGVYAGTAIGSFAGSLDHLQVWQRALRTEEIVGLQEPRSPNGPIESGIVAHWPLDSAVRGADREWRTAETVRGADLTVSGFGNDQSQAFVDDPERGRVLSMTGASRESVSLGRPVIDGSASFSVAVWVKVGDPSKPMVVARQGTSTKDAWRFEYTPVDEYSYQWSFARGNADSDTETVATSTADRELEPADGWHLLVGTYESTGEDAFGNPTGEISLTVDLRGSNGGTQTYLAPTRAGNTVLGTPGPTGTPFIGRLDDIRIYAGVLSQSKACTEWPDLQNCGS